MHVRAQVLHPLLLFTHSCCPSSPRATSAAHLCIVDSQLFPAIPYPIISTGMHAINHADTKHICTHMHPCTHMHEYFLLRFACWTLLQLAARERVRKHHELLRTAQQCWKAVGAAPRTWHGRVQEPRSLLYTRGAMKTTLFDRPGRNMKSDPPGLLGVQVSRNYWEHLPEIRKHDALMDEFCDRWDGIEEVCPPLRG